MNKKFTLKGSIKHKVKRKFLVAFVLVCFSFISFSQIPVELQVLLALKILTFDKNFSRFGNPIKIAVTSDEILNSFKAIEGTIKVKGRNFKAEKISSPSEISNYNVLFIGKNWKSKYAEAGAKAEEAKVIAFGEEEECVKSGAAGVGFKVVEGKPKIIINITSSKAQGSEFPTTLLKMAILIK